MNLISYYEQNNCHLKLHTTISLMIAILVYLEKKQRCQQNQIPCHFAIPIIIILKQRITVSKLNNKNRKYITSNYLPRISLNLADDVV